MRVLILGKGLVGKALSERLSRNQALEVKSIGRLDCDLRRLDAVTELFKQEKPDTCIFAAGVVGGIEKNLSAPADLILENSRIIINVIEQLAFQKIPQLINLAPACVYPSDLNRRMVPTDLFMSPMESSSLPYSTSKLAGIVMVDAIRAQHQRNWISLIPTNLYGDNIALESHKAHVIPALIKKFTEAKIKGLDTLELLGDGTPIREFLHVDDLAEAVSKVLEVGPRADGIINIAGTDETSIADLADLIKGIVGFEGDIVFSGDGKNGAPRKLLDGTRIQDLGWNPKITLEAGLRQIFKIVDQSRASH